MASVIRVGVIGTGIGTAHLDALRAIPDVAVTAVCSAQRERAEAVAARYGVSFATDDYHALLAGPVDAVVIATPPALHAPMVLAACAAGKAILCEKPLATSTGEARALAAAADAAGIVAMLNHQMRQSPPLRRAGELVAAGFLGRPTVADIVFTYNPEDYLRSPEGSPSKSSWYTAADRAGGVFCSSAGPHLIDACLALFGPIASVGASFAVTRPDLAAEADTPATAEDAFIVQARFANGAIGTIRAIPVAYRAYGYTIELHGTAGSLVVRPQTLHGATSGDPSLAALDLPQATISPQVAHTTRFLEAVRAGGPAPAPTFTAGVAIQEVMRACALAARSRRWIEVISE